MNLPSIEEIIFLVPILLLSLSLHEFAHGYVSHKLGDPTPKLMGRLTINPLAHLDLMGSLFFVFMLVTYGWAVGWAKPVPINPRYYKKPRKGMMLVGLAGPGANFLLAVIFSLIVKGLIMVYYNGFYSGIIVTSVKFFSTATYINLLLGVFNLIPLPPLDGSKILRGFLPPRFDHYFNVLEGPLGMILILALFYFGILWKIIFPVVELFANLLL